MIKCFIVIVLALALFGGAIGSFLVSVARFVWTGVIWFFSLDAWVIVGVIFGVLLLKAMFGKK